MCFQAENDVCVATMSPDYFPRPLNVTLQAQPKQSSMRMFLFRDEASVFFLPQQVKWFLLSVFHLHFQVCMSPVILTTNQAVDEYTDFCHCTKKLVKCLLFGSIDAASSLYLCVCVWGWCINTPLYSTASAVKPHLRDGDEQATQPRAQALGRRSEDPSAPQPNLPSSQYFLIISAAPQMCISPPSPYWDSTLFSLRLWMCHISMRT